MSMIHHASINDGSAVATAGAEDEHRHSERRVVNVRWVAKSTSGKGQELCLIRNISAGGIMANIYSTHEVGEQIGIEIRSGQQLDGEIVWTRDGCIGVQFANEIDVDDMLKVLSADRKRLRARAPRIAVYGRAHIKVGNRVISVDLCDLSQGGVKLTLPEPIEAENEVIVSISGLEDRESLIRWQQEGRAGLSIVRQLPFFLSVEWFGAHFVP